MARIHKHHTYINFVAHDQEKKINAGNNGTQYVSLFVGKSAQSIVPINHKHMHGFRCLTITLNCLREEKYNRSLTNPSFHMS